MQRPLIIAVLLAVPAAAYAADTIQPGQWQTTVKTTPIAMPGVEAGTLQAMMGKPVIVTDCVTEADVKQGPKALLDASDGQCSYSKFELAGGRIDTVATCKRGSATTTVTTKGSYTPTSIKATSSMSGTNGMKMTSEMTSTRIGACPK